MNRSSTNILPAEDRHAEEHDHCIGAIMARLHCGGRQRMSFEPPLDLEGAESASTEESAGHETEESSSEHQLSLSYGDGNSFAAVHPTDIDYNRDRRARCHTSRNANVQLHESCNSARAATCVLNSRRYSADDALRMGLVNAVVDDDALEATVEAWCDELAALSPRYLEITKISSNVWWNAARDSFSTGLGMLVQAIGSADMVEGASAFLEKRRPRFPDPE